MSLTVFHGTDGRFLHQILTGVDNGGLSQYPLRKFAEALWDRALEIVAGNWLQLAEVIQEAGSENGASAPLAVKNFVEKVDQSRMAYGGFYVTLNPAIACRYALGGVDGSELLLMLRELLSGLTLKSPTAAHDIRAAFPTCLQLINAPPFPVVVKCAGISESRLGEENGDAFDPSGVTFYEKMKDKAFIPAAYRIDRIASDDVVEVFDLSQLQTTGEFLTPDTFFMIRSSSALDLIQDCKILPNDWLKRHWQQDTM
jgi:hypothetical protein